jgi:hypothetical protein
MASARVLRHFVPPRTKKGLKEWDAPVLLVTLREWILGHYVLTIRKAVYEEDIEFIDTVDIAPAETRPIAVVPRD